MPSEDARAPGGARGSLRGRLLVALIVPLAGLFLIGGAASYGLAQYFADTVYDGWLFDSVSSLALAVNRTAKGPVVDMPASTRELFEYDVTDKVYFRIAGARRGTIAGRADIPPIAQAADIDAYHGIRLYDGRMDGQDVRVATLELPAEEYGEVVTLEVAETTGKRRGLARAILLSTLIPQILLIVVAAMAIRRAVGHGLAPLQIIAERLQARSHRQLSPLPDRGVPAEVRPLTGALNDLLSRLESALSAQRRFVAEAAHQLRTPLTAIKLLAEEMGRERDLEDARPLLESLRTSTDRAARLSNQLLSLARAEPDGGATRPFGKVDLFSLVRETGAEWAPRALTRGLDMRFSSETGERAVWIDGDADLLREAIGNLLDNAIKYHGGSGSIHLRVVGGPEPRIDVDDDGPGIAAELRPSMLRRFVRGDRGEGSGLGLPIAQEIARLHRGDLLLADASSGRGLSARLVFRAESAETGSGAERLKAAFARRSQKKLTRSFQA